MQSDMSPPAEHRSPRRDSGDGPDLSQEHPGRSSAERTLVSRYAAEAHRAEVAARASEISAQAEVDEIRRQHKAKVHKLKQDFRVANSTNLMEIERLKSLAVKQKMKHEAELKDVVKMIKGLKKELEVARRAAAVQTRKARAAEKRLARTRSPRGAAAPATLPQQSASSSARESRGPRASQSPGAPAPAGHRSSRRARDAIDFVLDGVAAVLAEAFARSSKRRNSDSE
jgi:DNA polymerase III gamma/tau subunit